MASHRSSQTGNLTLGDAQLGNVPQVAATGVSKTQLGVAKITGTTTRTVNGIARVDGITTRTQSGVANIGASTEKLRVTQQLITVAQQTPAPQLRVTQDLVTVAVLPGTTRTISGKAKITGSTTRTTQGKASMIKITTQTQSGVGHVTGFTQQTQSGKANLYGITSRTTSGKANLYGITTQTNSGVARLAINQTINGVASIVVVFPPTGQFRNTQTLLEPVEYKNVDVRATQVCLEIVYKGRFYLFIPQYTRRRNSPGN